MSIYEDLLVDAIDLHCHIDLELSDHAYRKRAPEWEWLPQAEKLRMRGVVLKSHWWPTTASVPYIRQLYQGSVQLWPSITLNPVAGGAEVWAVESAAALGGRVVFLPTWSSRSDLERLGFSMRISEVYKTFHASSVHGISFADEQGRLTRRGQEILAYCAEHDLTLATGHIAVEESILFAECARSRGFKRLIFSHPLGRSVDAPLELVQRVAGLGAWVELCWPNIAQGALTPKAAVEWIYAVGVEHVVASTDYFQPPQPVPPELLRMLLGTLYDAGLKADDVRRVAAINPARALGLSDPAL